MIVSESSPPPFYHTVHTLAPEQVEAWMDLVEQPDKPRGIFMSDHFLYIGAVESTLAYALMIYQTYHPNRPSRSS